MSMLSTEEHPARDQHPIPAYVVDHCIEQFGDPDRDESEYHELLALAQHELEATKLQYFIQQGRPSGQPVIETLHADPEGYVFADQRGDFWDDLFERKSLRDVAMQTFIVNTHHMHAQQYGEPDPIPDWFWENPLRDEDDHDELWEGIAIGTSRTWRHAESMVDAYLQWCAEQGCSAAQMLDYWVCAVDATELKHGEYNEQRFWASRRGADPSSVSRNIKKALSAIREADEPFEETEAYAEYIGEYEYATDEGVVSVWNDAQKTIYHLFEMLSEGGATPAQTIDYWMCDCREHTQTEWAQLRGVDQSTVSENIKKAREVYANIESTFKPTEPDPEQEKIRKEVYDQLQAENDPEELREKYEDERAGDRDR